MQLCGCETFVVPLECGVLTRWREHHAWCPGYGQVRVVGGFEPGVGEQGVRGVGDGAIERFGYKHVDARAQVLDERGSVLDAGRRGDEVQRRNAIWNEEALGSGK